MRKWLLRARKLYAILIDRKLSRAFFTFGVAGSIEALSFLRTVKPDTVIDVGANRGQFALAARLIYPNARIISFEPLATPARRFSRLFSRDPLVTLHQVAIASDRGEAILHIAKDDDSSSLLHSTEFLRRRSPGAVQCDQQLVKTGRILDFLVADDLRGACLLKIDVQGSELEVLRSSAELLPRIDWIHVEASFVPLYESQELVPSLISFLLLHDFLLVGMYNVMEDEVCGTVLQADFFFSKKDRMPGRR